MISISNVKELNKIIKNQLITQSELNQKRVLNSISNYGETLDKMLEKYVFSSIEKTDVVLLFELTGRQNDSNISFTNENSNLIYYSSYKLYIILYGDSSPDVANKIVSRFRTQKVRNDLYDNGVYLEYIDNPNTINEFKNGSLWIRTDIEIGISCEFSITQTSDDSNFSVINKITIDNKN